MDTFLIKHQIEIEKYPINEPIFLFLRKLNKKDVDIFSNILFYFGEIDETDKNNKMYYMVGI